MGNIHNTPEQNDNVTTEALHSHRKNNVSRLKRKFATTENKDSTDTHSGKCPRTYEHIYEPLSITTKHVRSVSYPNISDQHMQQEDQTGNISQHNYNTESGLPNYDISGTNRRGPISGDFLFSFSSTLSPSADVYASATYAGTPTSNVER
jgi:hypothetical protein